MTGRSWATVYDWVNPENGAYQAEFHDAYTHGCKGLIRGFLIERGTEGFSQSFQGRLGIPTHSLALLTQGGFQLSQLRKQLIRMASRR